MKPPMPEPPMPIIGPAEQRDYYQIGKQAMQRRASGIRRGPQGWVNVTARIQAELAGKLSAQENSRPVTSG